ncbi:MAG: translation initiation factor IF-3 [Fimbriimonadaceae bacterium]|nr:translation initiation factor IF-3 [Fimbriimonadaceae bacterium]
MRCEAIKKKGFRGRPRRDPGPNINKRLLKYDQLRIIGADGVAVGVISSRDALKMAEDVGLDLVLVAPNAEPPVAKIVDHGKYKYEQDKQKKDQKKKPQEVKGIKISPNIAENDMRTATRKATDFLAHGDKVRVVCRFKFRELAYPDRGKEKLLWIAKELEEHGKPEKEPILNGREMVMVINPKPASGGSQKKNAKAEDTQDSSEEV